MDPATVNETNQPTDRLRQIAEACRGEPRHIIAHWPGSIAELAATLDCDEYRALLVAIFPAPRREQNLSIWAADVASHLKLDIKRVQALGARCRR